MYKNIKSKIYPDDYNKNFGTLGIKLPTNPTLSDSNDRLFALSYTTEEQAVSNYINLLLTRKGERFMQPEFGVGLMDYIFENITPDVLLGIETVIELQAQQWLPYIINHEISTAERTDIDRHMIGIKITFSVTEFGANTTLSIFKTDGPPYIEVTTISRGVNEQN